MRTLDLNNIYLQGARSVLPKMMRIRWFVSSKEGHDKAVVDLKGKLTLISSLQKGGSGDGNGNCM